VGSGQCDLAQLFKALVSKNVPSVSSQLPPPPTNPPPQTPLPSSNQDYPKPLQITPTQKPQPRPKPSTRRVAKATGASVVLTLADMEGNETFDAANLGSAEEVVEERVADDSMVVIKGAKTSRAATLLLVGGRGAWCGLK